ncbi:MAG: hypothetical protein KIG68_08820 [Oxalobacter sp.]|nr:hypothetical protein [Oxalobacter sp.]
MRKIHLLLLVALGLVSASAYSGCPLDGYSNLFKVTVNKKPVNCTGTQIAYFSAGAMTGGSTAVCSREKTKYPNLKTAYWVADSYEGRDGVSNSFGKNCTFSKTGDWKCKKWMKNVKVNIDTGGCIESDNTLN